MCKKKRDHSTLCLKRSPGNIDFENTVPFVVHEHAILVYTAFPGL